MSALVICHSKHNSQIISNGKTLLGCLCTDLQRHMFGNSAQKSKCDHRTRANTLTTRLHSWQTRDYRITFAEIKQRVVVSTSPSNWHLIDVKYESEDHFHDQPRVWLRCDTARWIINNPRQNIIRNTSLNIQTAIFVFLRTSAAVFGGFQYQLGS